MTSRLYEEPQSSSPTVSGWPRARPKSSSRKSRARMARSTWRPRAYVAGVPTPSDHSVFRLRVHLDDVLPTVWRRLLVPGSIRLAVRQAVGEGRRFAYDYDFGDPWRHDVVVEDVTSGARGLNSQYASTDRAHVRPRTAAGRVGTQSFSRCCVTPPTRTTPTSFSGSVATFDQTRFDLVAVNAALQRLR